MGRRRGQAVCRLAASPATAGPLVASQVGFSAPQREMIAFAYQFGTLIMPTVVPAVVWVLTHRVFLDRMRGATGTPSA